MAKPVTQNCASAYNDFRANNHDQYINVIYKGDIECQNKTLYKLHACKDFNLHRGLLSQKKNYPSTYN